MSVASSPPSNKFHLQFTGTIIRSQSLEYIDENNLPVVVSGAGTSSSALSSAAALNDKSVIGKGGFGIVKRVSHVSLTFFPPHSPFINAIYSLSNIKTGSMAR